MSFVKILLLEITMIFAHNRISENHNLKKNTKRILKKNWLRDGNNGPFSFINLIKIKSHASPTLPLVVMVYTNKQTTYTTWGCCHASLRFSGLIVFRKKNI